MHGCTCGVWHIMAMLQGVFPHHDISASICCGDLFFHEPMDAADGGKLLSLYVQLQQTHNLQQGAAVQTRL